MFTVSDIIHLIQYYYRSSSYDAAAADVETFRLESLRGPSIFTPRPHPITLTSIQILRSSSVLLLPPCLENTPQPRSSTRPNS